MSVSILHILAAFAVLSWILLLWVCISYVLHKHYAMFRNAEYLMLGFVILSLGIILQLYVVSLLPIQRPLDHLFLLQVGIFITLLILLDWRGLYKYFTSLIGAMLQVYRSLDLECRIFVVVPLIVLFGYFCLGLFLNPGGIDAFTYHIPVAIQPIQDGVIGDYDSPIPWAYLYPKGVELVWSWSMLLAKSDILFHTINFLFGLQLLLAVWSLGKNVGLKNSQAIVPVMIIISMPIFFLLVTNGYIDLAYAAQVVSLLAILSHITLNKDNSILRIIFAGFILSLAMLIKVPVSAVLVFIGGFILHFSIVKKDCIKLVLHNYVRVVVLAGVAIILSLSPYLANLWYFHNPLYPLEVSFGAYAVLPGIVDASQFGLGGSSVMGSINEMNYFQRFYATWFDTFTSWTENSSGGFGVAFLASIIFYMMFMVSKKTYTSSSGKFLAISSLLLLLVPAIFLPRYGIPLASLMLVAGAIIVASFSETEQRSLRRVVFALLLVSFLLITQHVHATLSWLQSQSGGHLSWDKRSYFIYEIFDQGGYPNWIKADAIKLLRDRSVAGDTIVWNGNLAPTFLWNRDYSNRNIFVPASPTERYPFVQASNDITDNEKLIWLKKIKEIDPKHIIVKVDSVYPNAIQSIGKYEVIYSDSESHAAGYIIFEKTIE